MTLSECYEAAALAAASTTRDEVDVANAVLALSERGASFCIVREGTKLVGFYAFGDVELFIGLGRIPALKITAYKEGWPVNPMCSASHVYVHPDFQGQGIAVKMYHLKTKTCQELGYNSAAYLSDTKDIDGWLKRITPDAVIVQEEIETDGFRVAVASL